MYLNPILLSGLDLYPLFLKKPMGQDFISYIFGSLKSFAVCLSFIYWVGA